MTDLILRRRELEFAGTTDSSIRKSLRDGSLVRVAAGAYVDGEAWRSLDDIDQHRMRVQASAERLTTTPVFSHFAAAALWGIRLLGAWPNEVDVTLDRTTGGRSNGGMRRHCTGTSDIEVVTLNGLAVTSPAQTVVDLARVLPFADAVVAMDCALHRRRKPHPLATPDDIARVIDTVLGRHRYRRAVAAAGFATPLSDSVEESHSRVWLHLLGFPQPELQKRFELSDGRHAEVDFYWEGFEHVGECDGRSKYFSPAITGGRTPREVFFAEKSRENDIRRQVRMFSRWEPKELYPARQLFDRLVKDGLPSRKPRP